MNAIVSAMPASLEGRGREGRRLCSQVTAHADEEGERHAGESHPLAAGGSMRAGVDRRVRRPGRVAGVSEELRVELLRRLTTLSTDQGTATVTLPGRSIVTLLGA